MSPLPKLKNNNSLPQIDTSLSRSRTREGLAFKRDIVYVKSVKESKNKSRSIILTEKQLERLIDKLVK